MDGRTGAVIDRIKEVAGATTEDDGFHEKGNVDQEARQTKYAAEGGGVYRPRRVSLLDEEVSNEQVEMLERIRVAAGQTS